MRVIILCCTVALLGTLPCTLGATPPLNEQPQVGRYQMVTAYGTVYVIDTATGQCWSQDSRGRWIDEGNPTKPQKVAAKSPPTLVLPQTVVSLTLKQRSSKAIPGSDERIFLQVDDITGGQVLVSVRDDEGKTVLDDVSAKQGDVVSFKVGAKTYFIRVKELQNFLVGDDIAVLEIATNREAFQSTDTPEAGVPKIQQQGKKPADQ